MRFVDPSGHNAELIHYIAQKNDVDLGVAKAMLEADQRSGQNNYGAFDNAPSTAANGVNFGQNEGADWLRTGSGKSFEDFWGVGPYGMPVQAPSSPALTAPDNSTNVVYSINNSTTEPSPSGEPVIERNVKSSRDAILTINGNKITDAVMDGETMWGNARQIAVLLGLEYRGGGGGGRLGPIQIKIGDVWVNAELINGVFMYPVRKMITAAGYDDCLSWWNDDLGSHITMHKDIRNAPVKVIRQGYEITITGYVVFTGDYENTHTASLIKYAQLAIDGIEQHWTGQNYKINGRLVNVTTKIIDVTNWANKPSHFTINIGDYNGTDVGYMHGAGAYSYWSIAGGKDVQLYRRRNVTTTTSSGSLTKPEPFTATEFMRIAAHEFGHVLGLCDAYPDDGGTRPMADPIHANRTNIMHYLPSDTATYEINSNNLAMMMQAYTDNEWQYWRSFDSNVQSIALP